MTVGGTGPGRRYATQQINRAYAVLLAAHFQGFCRELLSESADELVKPIPPPVRGVVRAGFDYNRQLDRGNAQPSAIGSDFGRLGVTFWAEVDSLAPAKPSCGRGSWN